MSGSPTVPAFLTIPLECRGTCNQPLPPIPPRLSPVLASTFETWLKIASWQFMSSFAMQVPLSIINNEMVELMRTGITLQAFARTFAPDGAAFRVMETALREKITRVLDPSAPGTAMLLEKAFGGLLAGNFIPTMVVAASKHASPYSVCPHDFLKPSIDVDAITVEVQRLYTGVTQAMPVPIDSYVLTSRIEADIRAGKIRGSGWTGEGWRKEVETIQHRLTLVAARVAYERFCVVGGPMDGYFDIARNWPDFGLRLLAYLNTANPNAPLQNFVDRSPEIAQLIQLCRLSSSQRRRVLELAPLSIASAKRSAALERIESSSPPTPPPVQPCAEDARRIKILPNRSKLLPGVPLHPQPRCCPPHRCTNRPPYEEAYDSVEESINSIFRDRLSAILTDDHWLRFSNLRLAIVKDFLFNVDSLDSSVESDTKLEKYLEERAMIYFGPENERRGVEIIISALNQLRTVVSGHLLHLHRGPPPPDCLCELTHRASDLKIAATITASNTTRWFDHLASRPYDLGRAEILQYIKDNLRGGTLSSECWASGWEGKFDGWLERVMKEITKMLSDHKLFEVYCGELNDVLGVFGSSKLLEGMWAADRNANTPHTLAAIGLWNSDTKPQLSIRYYHAEGDNHHRMGGAEVHLLEHATYMYAQAMVRDASNWQASLNSAATHLRMADDGKRDFEWGLAIQDCTIALYYGRPNFKAFYRRGLALAHLKMYKKAILDFEQALLLEPQNPVALLHLALARKNKHA